MTRADTVSFRPGRIDFLLAVCPRSPAERCLFEWALRPAAGPGGSLAVKYARTAPLSLRALSVRLAHASPAAIDRSCTLVYDPSRSRRLLRRAARKLYPVHVFHCPVTFLNAYYKAKIHLAT